ncbi:MAG TPA: zf-HC2 domain-containing protein [Anaerolineae bacterium]|nr:zf-HC2 domain-containing protein [Anaerolineae bacterium]
MAASELSCRELVELITDYLEETLPFSERARFEQHLAMCDGCLNYLAQMRQTIRALGRLTEDSIEPQVQHDLLQIFRDWKKR